MLYPPLAIHVQTLHAMCTFKPPPALFDAYVSCVRMLGWRGCCRALHHSVSHPNVVLMGVYATRFGMYDGIPTLIGHRYHLFASAMTNGCGLGAWSSNSRVEHAVSAEPTGPFLFKDVAINTWAHNTAPIALPGNAGYAIVRALPNHFVGQTRRYCWMSPLCSRRADDA